MSEALIPVTRGRPPVITVDGCVVFLSVRDAEYRRLKAVYKAQVIAAHPDKFPPHVPHETRAKHMRCDRCRWRTSRLPPLGDAAAGRCPCGGTLLMPDPRGPHSGLSHARQFRAAQARLAAWLRGQRGIYWALHQMPPDWRGPLTPPPGLIVPAVPALLVGRWGVGRLKGAHCSAGAEVFPAGVHVKDRKPRG
jgi:hypothetical protein